MSGGAALLRMAITARSIYPIHGVGGLERHLHDLVRHLVGIGVRVHVVTRPPVLMAPRDVPTLASDLIDWSFVPYRSFPFADRRGTTVIDRSTAYPIFGLRAGARAARLAAAGEVDVVYGHGASVLGYARARKRGAVACPMIFNPHGLEEFGGPGQPAAKYIGYAPLRAAARYCARAADRVISTDQCLVPVIGRHLRIPEHRIRVVPNSVDLDACDASAEEVAARALRARLSMPPGTRVLLSAGRLEHNKGFHVLARALSDLLPRDGSGPAVGRPDWRWVLVGDGPARPRLERAIREHGIASRTLMAGHVSTPELHGWYRAADVFVHPTLYEGSSIVTLEAMTHALPVVATMAGGLPDKVVPGATGWLVEPGDPGELSRVILEALQDPSRLAGLGRAGRALVEERFSWPAAVQALMAVIRELVDISRGERLVSLRPAR
jgi:glycosyltransferase involved in cell wall biosynthesis